MTTASASVGSSSNPLAKHHFLLRRLHSLSGIMPVGVFVIFHLFTNMQIAFGTFQHEVEFIHNLPALLFLEIFGLWLPIAFHAILGFWYTFTGKANIKRYSYMDNWRYVIQRVTGIIALIFIFFHVATLRWGWTLGVETPFFVNGVTPSGEFVPLSTASTAIALQASILVTLLYIIGAYSVVFHWANGLWTAAISWGVTTTAASQKRWGLVCAGMGVALAIFSGIALAASLTYDPTESEWAAYEYMKENPDIYKKVKHGVEAMATPLPDTDG